MIPISYIVALLTSLCLIVYYIFGTEEKMWEINCEGILHGACFFSWATLLLGNSTIGFVLSCFIGFIAAFVAYAYIRARKYGASDLPKVKTDKEGINSDVITNELDIVGKSGKITARADGNTYIGILDSNKNSIVITIKGEDKVNIGDSFVITYIYGCDIFADIILKK